MLRVRGLKSISTIKNPVVPVGQGDRDALNSEVANRLLIAEAIAPRETAPDAPDSSSTTDVTANGDIVIRPDATVSYNRKEMKNISKEEYRAHKILLRQERMKIREEREALAVQRDKEILEYLKKQPTKADLLDQALATLVARLQMKIPERAIADTMPAESAETYSAGGGVFNRPTSPQGPDIPGPVSPLPTTAVSEVGSDGEYLMHAPSEPPVSQRSEYESYASSAASTSSSVYSDYTPVSTATDTSSADIDRSDDTIPQFSKLYAQREKHLRGKRERSKAYAPKTTNLGDAFGNVHGKGAPVNQESGPQKSDEL